MAIVTLRYWAAAKEAAGVAEEKVSAQTLAAALEAGLAAVRERADAGPEPAGSGAAGPGRSAQDRADRLRVVLARSSFLIDGAPAGIRPPESVTLADASVIEILPPFAGG